MRAVQCLVLFAAHFAATAAWSCELPALPDMPPAPEPGREQRRVADATQVYLGGMIGYVQCIQSEFEAAREAGASAGVLELLAERNNVAVAEFEQVVELFQERVGPIATLDVGTFAGAQNNAGRAALADAERCISVVRLRATRIVNEHTVLFFRRSGRAWLNILPEACPALMRSDGFTYEVRGARNATLCETDLIYPTGTAGAIACRLGPFREIAESEAETILLQDGTGRAGRPEDFEPVEGVESPDDAEQAPTLP